MVFQFSDPQEGSLLFSLRNWLCTAPWLAKASRIKVLGARLGVVNPEPKESSYGAAVDQCLWNLKLLERCF